MIPELKKYTIVDLDHFDVLTNGLMNPRFFKLGDEKSQFIKQRDGTFQFKIYIKAKRSFRLVKYCSIEKVFKFLERFV